MGECLMQTVSNAIEFGQLILERVLPTARTVVDATAGNGSDTLFLAQRMSAEARLYAFDIQPLAIAATRQKTKDYADRITYLLDSHENIPAEVPGEIDAAVFNLGYLPGTDHRVTTEAEITLKAVQGVLQKLRVNGVLVIVVYPGHPAGQEEKKSLEEYFRLLSPREFTVGCYTMMNHTEDAPFSYLIEKVRG